ncbi:PepSY domain-containing protein [Neobacillus sp. NPDC058068]|uniref:PepSY domain-containing protein n=1 Tax=Neobacillus sp. NPDC058068 TaxID=3346325 RepID=UPI0036D99569
MNKKFLIPALAVSIIGGGIAGSLLNHTTFAASNTNAPVEKSQEKEVSDASEQATLKKQAKITEADAIKIALAKVPGTNNGTELENEDGKVVYGVEVKDSKNNLSDVKVDAVTGTIIKIDTNDKDKSEGENGQKDDKEVKDDQKQDNDKEIADESTKQSQKEQGDNDKEISDDDIQTNHK